MTQRGSYQCIQYLRDKCQEDETRLLPVVPSGHKLKHRKFHLNMRRSFFTLNMTEHWNRLLREAVEFPYLEIFNIQLYVILQLALGEPSLAERLGYMILRDPFQHNCSVIL